MILEKRASYQSIFCVSKKLNLMAPFQILSSNSDGFNILFVKEIEIDMEEVTMVL